MVFVANVKTLCNTGFVFRKCAPVGNFVIRILTVSVRPENLTELLKEV